VAYTKRAGAYEALGDFAGARAGEAAAVAELEVNAGQLKTKERSFAVIELYLGALRN
jgi:hypothetical protein